MVLKNHWPSPTPSFTPLPKSILPPFGLRLPTIHRRSVFNTWQSQKPEPTAPVWRQHEPGVRKRNGVTGNGGGEQFPILDAPVPVAQNSEKGPATGTDSCRGIGRKLLTPARVKFGNRSRTPDSLTDEGGEIQVAGQWGGERFVKMGN